MCSPEPSGNVVSYSAISILYHVEEAFVAVSKIVSFIARVKNVGKTSEKPSTVESMQSVLRFVRNVCMSDLPSAM